MLNLKKKENKNSSRVENKDENEKYFEDSKLMEIKNSISRLKHELGKIHQSFSLEKDYYTREKENQHKKVNKLDIENPSEYQTERNTYKSIDRKKHK